MGRPLNKKYFGNRNVGVGGEGIASYTLPGQLGSIEVDTDSGQPTLTIPAPTLPGGVQATATVTWEVESITINTDNDYGTGYVEGETVTFSGATGVTATITVVADDITVITPVNRGSFTTIPTNTSYNVIGAVGNDAQAEIKWRVKTIAMTAQGSGYTTAPTLSWTAGLAGPISGTSPGAPTAVLTTANSENAIVIRAKTTSGGTSQAGDIVKQEASRRYKVTTADGTAVCRLVADDTPAFKEAYIVATSAAGGTYYVIKLTAHRATLVAKAGDSALAGKSVQWTFDAPSGSIVQIENA